MPNKTSVDSFNSDRKYFEPYGLTCVYWRPSSMQRPDYHNEIELNFLQSGTVTYLYGGRKITLEAGRLTAFWAAIPHQVIDFSSDVVYFAATIPLQSFLQWRMPEKFTQALMQGQFLSEDDLHMAESDAKLFKCWEQDLSTPSVELEKPVMLEMQARLTRLALAHAKNTTSHTKPESAHAITTSELTKVEQIACYIMKNYTEKITIQEISENVDLTPNYTMSLFRQTFGSTIGEYLTQHRVSHAQRLLTTTPLPIMEVALEAGFASISRFNDAFNRSSGCSPRQYRQKHRL